ncbi:lipid A ethanolaminephosphotransferase [Pseudomonas marincola]|nr:lipid A ethanolaminephosphotransferase [Pseudomonas marincola]
MTKPTTDNTPNSSSFAWKISLSRPMQILLVSVWLLVFSNSTFWTTVWQGIGGWDNGSPLFLLSLPVLALLWTFGLLTLLAWGRMTKWVLGLFLIVSASASYFMNSFGIVIDYDMLTNVVQTDTREALELLSPRMFIWIALLGVLPAFLLTRIETRKFSWKRELSMKLVSVVVALAGIGGIAMSEYQSYASLFRNHREIRLQLTPSNVVSAVNGYVRRELKTPTQLEVIGADAHRQMRVGNAVKPRLTIVVVGETARAENFALNGYKRDTNPELSKQNIINFTNASSCGTATAVSVPCMFQQAGRDDYKPSMATSREGLLDVLKHAGVNVLWRDNNSGCKGACDRVASVDVSNLGLADICEAGGECHDEALLSGLQDYLDTLKDDTVVVLHMKGSHGPSYSKRYPQAFEHFTPVCQSSELDQCSTESIVNAYDNSLRYTDHVLAQTIKLLKANQTRFDTAMLYMSDHGESLGENGIYLHGLPYAMAPQQQTHIPMILWMSQGMEETANLQPGCLQSVKDKAWSQDNLFDSVLGLMAIQTSVYDPARDMFHQCQAPQQASTISGTQEKGVN